MSDSELLAAYALPQLVHQESGGRAGIIGPQTRYGRAEGMTQMLPATAQATAQKVGLPWRPELMRGNSEEAAAYQQQLGQAYLQEGIDRTGSLDGGLRYYHGGPDQRQWGPKTNAYAQAIMTKLGAGGAPQEQPMSDLSQMSDEELLALYNQPQEVGRSKNGGTTIDVSPAMSAAPLRGPVKAVAPAPVAPADRGILGRAWDATTGAARDFGQEVGRDYQASTQGKMDLLATARMLGKAVNVPLAGIGSIQGDLTAEPIAQAMDAIPLQAYARPQLGNLAAAPRKLSKDETHQANLKTANLALSAAQPAKLDLNAARSASLLQAPVKGANLTQQVRAVTPQMPAKPPVLGTPTVDDLAKVKRRAYQQAEASGAVIQPPDAQKLAADVRAIVDAKGGEDLYPTASKMVKRLENLATKGLTPTQLEDYRGQIYEQLMSDGGKEYRIGKDIRSAIDGVMNSDPRWADARAANTRYEKVKEITDRLESADIGADTNLSGAGQSLARQKKLRPLIDPKSNQRMYNLTPAEQKALTTVVRGTAGSKATRYAGQFMKNRFIQGASLSAMGPLGLPGIVAPLALDVAGTVATKSAEAQTAKQIEKLLHLLGTGAQAAPKAAAALPSVQDAAAALQAIQLLRPKPSGPTKKATAKSGK